MEKEILKFLKERIKKLKKECSQEEAISLNYWKKLGALEEARWIENTLKRKFFKRSKN